LLFIPAFQSLLTQFCVFPSVKKLLIDPYYKEHPGEDIEKMRALGIEAETDEPKQEAVFVDRGSEQKRAKKGSDKKEWQFPTPHPGRRDDDDDTI